MKGKTVAITGCTTGCGYLTAMECARLGARIILLNRPSTRAEKALQSVKTANMLADWYAQKSESSSKVQPVNGVEEKNNLVEHVHVDCDMLSLESVQAAAKRIQEIVGDEGLAVLVLNAGMSTAPKGAKDTQDGFDTLIQVNHIAHMLLLKDVWPCLEAAAALDEARVVFHSSNGRVAAKTKIKAAADEGVKELPLSALRKNQTAEWKPKWKNEFSYYLAKSFNFVSAMALHEKLAAKGSRVKALCAHPGMATTKTLWDGHGRVAVCFGNMLAKSMAQSESDGGMPLLTCVVDKNVASGDFYGPSGFPKKDGPDVLRDGGQQLKGMPTKITLSPFEIALVKEWSGVFDETYKGLETDFQFGK